MSLESDIKFQPATLGRLHPESRTHTVTRPSAIAGVTPYRARRNSHRKKVCFMLLS